MRLRPICFFLFLLALPLSAKTERLSAAHDSISSVQAAAVQIPEQLLAQGVTQLGPLDLKSFISQVPIVEAHFVPALTALAPNGAPRIFTSWMRARAQASVGINSDLWPRLDDGARSVLALNAYLNALGYSDQDYQMTLSLWFMTLDSARKSMTEPQYQYALNLAKSAALKASSEASGGGDLSGLMMKQAMIEHAIGRYQEDSTAELQNKILTAFRVALLVEIEATWVKK